MGTVILMLFQTDNHNRHSKDMDSTVFYQGLYGRRKSVFSSLGSWIIPAAMTCKLFWTPYLKTTVKFLYLQERPNTTN